MSEEHRSDIHRERTTHRAARYIGRQNTSEEYRGARHQETTTYREGTRPLGPKHFEQDRF